LLSPRNTVITDTRPTFSWQPVAGASGYRLTVNPLGGGETWSVETTATHLPYPPDALPLAPGSRNSATLVTIDNDQIADKTLLQVLDETSLAELVKAEAEIRALPLDEAAQTYLPLIGERVWEGSLRQQLGDLYFQAGLYAQAEENYKAVLTAAKNSGDLSGQAAASAELAHVAYAFKEIEPALEYLSTAEALYRQAGQSEQADLIAAERAKLEK
jgi:tetratricopeptide (TPR) repeat protein